MGADSDRVSRLASLMRVPSHKPVIKRFDGTPNARTITPLTYEDLGSFHNINLINTLREAVDPKGVHAKD